MRIETILLATDLSPLAIAALPVVAGLARDLGAKVQFIYADPDAAELQGTAATLEMRDVQGRLESLQRAARAWGLDTTARVLNGEPKDALRAAAERDRHALLTLVHAVGHQGRASLTRSLVIHTAAPILIVHAPALADERTLATPIAQSIQRVCCAVSPEERGSASLRVTAAFAESLGARLSLATVLFARGIQPNVAGKEPLLPDPPPQLNDELQAAHLRLSALTADLTDGNHGCRVVAAEDPAAGLAAAALTMHADLIVAAPRQRGAIARALLGSVTDRLLQLSPLPLLVLGEKAAMHVEGAGQGAGERGSAAGR